MAAFKVLKYPINQPQQTACITPLLGDLLGLSPLEASH